MRHLSRYCESRFKLQLIIAIFSALSITHIPGCSLLVDPADEVRIVPHRSIDGVTFGDTKETVVQKLGQPDLIEMGDFPGVAYRYNTGTHATMNVVIYSPGTAHPGVVSISVRSPYTGMANGRIGIGSQRSSVKQQLGQPDTEGVSDDTTWERYEDGTHFFLLEYRGETVELISMKLQM